MKVGKVTGLKDRQFDLDEYDTVEYEFSDGSKILVYFDKEKQRLRLATMGQFMPNLAIVPGGGTNSAFLYTVEQSKLNPDQRRPRRDKKPEET